MSPLSSPSSLWLGPKQLPCTTGRMSQQLGLSCQISCGGCEGSPLPGAGLRAGLWTPDRSRMGQPPVPGARCKPGLAAGRAEEAEAIMELHLQLSWATGGEHSQGRAWEQHDGEHSLCQCPQARSYPRSIPAPPGHPAHSPCSCFPATPSRYEWPGFPLWEISCFPDCRTTGFSWTSSLPPFWCSAHRVRSACHAASMSE